MAVTTSAHDARAVAIAAGDFTIHVRSVAGIESCCYVEEKTVDVAFDMGCCFGKAWTKGHVFITHGHVDHINAFPTHAARRHLERMKPARYYVPHHLVEHAKRIMDAFSAMQEDEIKIEVVAMQAHMEVAISPHWVVKAVPTCHRVPSLGYVLYRKKSVLRREFVGKPTAEIRQLRQDGVDVMETLMTPEIAYTGDTTIDVFKAEDNDLTRAQVLITEATYVSDWKTSDHAHERGHIHLNQIVEHSHLFKDVKALVLMHFSAKYSPREVRKHADEVLNESLRSKVHLAVQSMQMTDA
ncbi:TPA: hypothetical protein N0F65_009449 [Lagenidium giganteum]|uniref:Metallo-beta-lactamase domain-containing protein n=1 Tax=Lagenidium giganteum TaxID=4803 RepID=A0AAV2ZBH4_9STRA|nr:TPA: hypothetical protein N0F65_009449 [Lagenidium giganteum]